MSIDGQRTKRLRNIAENFNRLSRVHERYRQQTDRQTTDARTTTYSERERAFAFAKKCGGRGARALWGYSALSTVSACACISSVFL